MFNGEGFEYTIGSRCKEILAHSTKLSASRELFMICRVSTAQMFISHSTRNVDSRINNAFDSVRYHTQNQMPARGNECATLGYKNL